MADFEADGERLAVVQRSNWRALCLEAEQPTYDGLWSVFSGAEQTARSADPDVADLYLAIAKVCSCWLDVEPSLMPYKPAIQTADGRSAVPDDLSTSDHKWLKAVLADSEGESLLRPRIADILGLCSTGFSKVSYLTIAVEAWSTWPFDSDLWWRDGRAAVSRALDICKKYGAPLKNAFGSLVTRLRTRFFSLELDPQGIALAGLFLQYDLLRDDAEEVAAHLSAIASRATLAPHFTHRRYLEEARAWYRRAHNPRSADIATIDIALCFVAEARKALQAQAVSHIVAATHFESALQALRSVPRSLREDLSLQGLESDLLAWIRAEGLEGLSEMTTFTSDAVDLTSIAAEAVREVQDRPMVEALAAFVNLSRFADYKALVEQARKALEDFPLAGLLNNVHLSGDGRVMHRGAPDDRLYDVPFAVWRQLSQSFAIHVGLTCQGLIVPAFNQLTQEHRPGIADCLALARGSAIVPIGHEYLFARGLQLGFESDFASAAHLLIPQVENLIRFHLRDAGVRTSTLTQDGRENEDGLTNLVTSSEFVDVFGEDIAFETRALFAGPTGPNLRNHVAHGLVEDDFATSMYGVYTWWFCLKLIFHPYWNRLRPDPER